MALLGTYILDELIRINLRTDDHGETLVTA